jgi:hypothetical protein
VTVTLGPVVIGDDNQPHVGTPMVVKTFVLHKNGVKRLVLPALRHRVILSPAAEIDGRKVDEVLGEIVARTEVPR